VIGRAAGRAWRAGWWALGVATLSLLPVAGLFTTTRVFYVRDLSFFFWSRHLWLRHTIFAGQAPWWDPYVAGGQSAIADALNQLVMPITLAVRLLPSDVFSFNLWVALPLPIAATGMFVFLSRRFAGEAGLNARATDDSAAVAQPFTPAFAAAALGAIVFALSGPIVSMLNTPNLAWSVAFLPWVLAGESLPAIAIAYALQALCGEPVTWAATGALALALRRDRRALFGLALGAAVAAAQLVPTAVAGMAAHRSALATPDFWSLHPLSLWETLAPHLFGNYFDAFLADLPWMGPLNFGRDPFFYSLYVGPLVLLLACGGARRWRRNAFWIAVAVAFTVAALGGYTPAYPLLRRAVPPLLYFRFPVKYIVFAIFAVAVLAADGWRERGSVRLAAAAGAVIVGVTLALQLMPATLTACARVLAVDTHVKDPAAAAAFLARAAPPLAWRAGAMLLAAALLNHLSRRRPVVHVLYAALVCADLLVTNGGLNPTLDVARLTPPSWFTASAGGARLYIGGRVRGYMNTADPDATHDWQIPAEADAVQGRMELNADLPMAPSGWGVREALSYDLPYLWPAEYEATVKRFEHASPAERDAFLRRTAVRWCVLPDTRADYPGQAGWRRVADVPNWNMRVYECHPDATRVTFAAGPRDLDALFDPSLPDAGAPGTAQLIEDVPSRVAVSAVLPAPALLVLRDSYDPSWRVEVDGRPTALVRVNGLQRGVSLTAGSHVVRFTYRPDAFLAGLSCSVAALVIIGLYRWRRNAASR